MNYVIIADVNCDLVPELRQRFDVDYLKGHIVINGEEHATDLDRELFKTPEEYYAVFNAKGAKLSTSPASTGETVAKFEEYLSKGIDVIYFALSSALSGSYNFALMAKKECDEKYPDRKVTVIDSLRYGTALGLLVAKCGELRLNGASYEEVVKFAEENKHRIHQMGPMDDLFYLAKAKRISKGKAFMGTLVGVKPLGDFNREGKAEVLIKGKGIKNAIDITINYIKRTIVNPSEQIVFVSDTNRKENAALIKERIEKEIHPKEVIYVSCAPAGATNIGPGLACAYYFGEPISENNDVERKIIEEVAAKK